ncbi:MAG TPA: hypothetical protein VJX67_03830 [Blastocatellia bacterium]|nr:hypothetical protein [Blastocatellia bacterium]
MIPKLEDGVLPEGVHQCSLDEVESVFGRFRSTERRPLLTAKLRAYISELRRLQLAVAIVVDGSYVTSKSNPGDIDLILVLKTTLDPALEMVPSEYNVLSKRMVKKRYGFDVLSAADGSQAYRDLLEFFSNVRPDDPEQATNRRKKGLLKVEL